MPRNFLFLRRRAIGDELLRLESDVAARRKWITIVPVQSPSDPVPDPSDSEVRLATEKILQMPQQKVLSVEGIRLMRERVADLEQKIASWNKILEQNPTDEAVR